jgi:hypothetical protein
MKKADLILLIALFIVCIICAPIIWQGWQDLNRTVTAADNFQP